MHREVVAVVDGVGVTEQGEVFRNLPLYCSSAPPAVWVTTDPASLLRTMMVSFHDVPAFNYQIVEARESDPSAPQMVSARLTRFGFRCRCEKGEPCTCGNPPKRKAAMHTVWSPGDMSRNPGEYLDGFTHKDLLTFGCDVRDWCRDNDLPLPTSLAGIAAALLRDSRFWPGARGRVPRATNENVRKYLPGVHSELLAPVSKQFHAVSLDQKAAYHRAAKEIPTPDPTTMYARGYYIDPDNGPIWAEHGSVLYNRTIQQPGVCVVQYSARHALKNECRLPWVKSGRNRAAVYTNEVEYAESQGVKIEGIIAAWTSCLPDTGLPTYGAWASERIGEASDYRKRWLKPTLHAAYGLLAMRDREVTIGHLRGRSEPRTFVLGAGHEFTAAARTLPRVPAATVNVAMLGVLQAEIRTRSLRMATALQMEGVEVLHIHADGIHVRGAIPLLPDSWTVKPRTNLEYIDRVSWLSDEGDVLPGREGQERIELRRHHAALLKAAASTRSRRRRTTTPR